MGRAPGAAGFTRPLTNKNEGGNARNGNSPGGGARGPDGGGRPGAEMRGAGGDGGGGRILEFCKKTKGVFPGGFHLPTTPIEAAMAGPTGGGFPFEPPLGGRKGGVFFFFFFREGPRGEMVFRNANFPPTGQKPWGGWGVAFSGTGGFQKGSLGQRGCSKKGGWPKRGGPGGFHGVGQPLARLGGGDIKPVEPWGGPDNFEGGVRAGTTRGGVGEVWGVKQAPKKGIFSGPIGAGEQKIHLKKRAAGGDFGGAKGKTGPGGGGGKGFLPRASGGLGAGRGTGGFFSGRAGVRRNSRVAGPAKSGRFFPSPKHPGLGGRAGQTPGGKTREKKPPAPLFPKKKKKKGGRSTRGAAPGGGEQGIFPKSLGKWGGGAVGWGQNGALGGAPWARSG